MDNTMTLDFNSKSNEELPLSITMNGIEYFSSKLFDSSQNLSKINLELSKVGLELCRNEVISEPSSPDGYESIINDALKYGDGYTAYQDGYFAGKKKGYDEGYKQGECDGFGKGYGRGFSEGHDIGWKAAKKEPQPNDHYYDDEELYELKKEWYEQGFADGKLSNCKCNKDEAFFRGYKKGMDRMVAEIVKPISRKKPLEEAFKRGYEVCKEDEFKKGYVEGYNACIDCFNINYDHKIDDNDVSDM
jgi:hypothetical protein